MSDTEKPIQTYADLNGADRRIVDLAVERYLKDATETGAARDERVQSLRGIFSSEQKLADLKKTTIETGYAQYLSSQYAPGYAGRGGR